MRNTTISGVKNVSLDGQMNQCVSSFKDGDVGPVENRDFRIGQLPCDVTAGREVSLDRVHVALDDAHARRQPVPVGLAQSTSQLTQATLVVKVVA